eukprot:gene4205-4766_t
MTKKDFEKWADVTNLESSFIFEVHLSRKERAKCDNVDNCFRKPHCSDFGKNRKSIDNGHMVGAVYIDLTKAFDTIGHGLLLHKQQEYGISGLELEWFTNYLFNRNQVVCVDKALSTKHQLLNGVPQGSILGPLLFIIFFNDFPDCVKHSRVVKYADDTVIYVNGKEKENIELLLNQDLKSVAEYFDSNELIINLKRGKLKQ